jgi:hypothetical protein
MLGSAMTAWNIATHVLASTAAAYLRVSRLPLRSRRRIRGSSS